MITIMKSFEEDTLGGPSISFMYSKKCTHLSCSPSSYSSSHEEALVVIPCPSQQGSSSQCGEEAAALSVEEARATANLRIHRQAERRRRERINGHLSTLRRLIPGTTKMDKASLLARVIDHVKDLTRKASDIGKGSTVPSENNEVRVECDGEDNLMIKASVCCEDRPDLFSDLTQAFRALKLTVIEAEIVCVGGRVKNVFILCSRRDGEGSVCLNSLRESMKEALDKIACSARRAFGRPHFNTVARRNADLDWYTRQNLWRPSFTTVAKGNGEVDFRLLLQSV
ncbi:Transcription factor bHLH30 [Acorus gramineus]|uniref:Transcription factor bHLH30 n=1 Tax=Acorus gramineus TaxID=55184 RepID=A0AAV9ANB4_ACOGR|nr:Transcription factor bHLH30 [Acorus gramineus]